MAYNLWDGCGIVSLVFSCAFVERFANEASCPRVEQCQCDVYGWCRSLPSGEVLRAMMYKYERSEPYLS